MIASWSGRTCRPCPNAVARRAWPKLRGVGCRRVNQTVFTPSLGAPRTTVGRFDSSHVVCNAVEAVSEEERKANEKRWEESGKAGDSDEWKWTLNWDDIMDNIVVGSCPRSPEDLDRIAEEAGATAVLCLQCDLCLEALGIDWESIRDRAVEKGVAMARVPIRDFDHGDQTLMLPEAVRTLAMLLALNNKVYVHCTAGINRATLTVLGYLTFVQGWELNGALEWIKSKRSQAHPYIDCWKSTKARLLQGRTEEVIAKARALSTEKNAAGDSVANWIRAENQLIQDTFRRQLACSLSIVSSLTELKAASVAAVCIMPQEMDRAEQEIAELKKDLEEERASLRSALDSLEQGNSVGARKNGASGVNDGPDPESCYTAFEELADAHKEIAVLRQGLREIAELSVTALKERLECLADTPTEEETEADSPVASTTEAKALASGTETAVAGAEPVAATSADKTPKAVAEEPTVATSADKTPKAVAEEPAVAISADETSTAVATGVNEPAASKSGAEKSANPAPELKTPAEPTSETETPADPASESKASTE